jgi:CRP-like cAMP-binding protein
LAGFVDSTAKEIETRLKELREEIAKLEGALMALGGSAVRRATGRRGPGRPRGSSSAPSSATTTTRAARRPGRPRGRRSGGTRADQALELVRNRPGITIPQIAEELKIEPNYLYRVMPRLVSEGKVRRDGQGWHPVSESDQA